MPQKRTSELRLPPQNVEAEQFVLGALMIDKNAIFKVADILVKEDFYTPAHEFIYESIAELFEKHQPIDLVSVRNRLRERDILKKIGGNTYLAELVNGVSTAAHILHYAQLIKQKRILRDLINTSADIAEQAFSPDREAAELLDHVEKQIFDITRRSTTRNFAVLKEELASAVERLIRIQASDSHMRGIPTGFAQIDNCLSGLQKSDLVIIGARPSLGKTALALDMARNIAVKSKQPVGIFSLEMSKDQLVDRLIASHAGMPLWKLRVGRVTDEQKRQIMDACDQLSGAPIFIDDTPSPTILEIRSMARRLQMQHGLSVLVVDYLQLIMPRTHSENANQQITEISRGLKSLARDLSIPVVAISQLSRNVDQREQRTPRLSDLRDSGSIEQDADVVMFIARKSGPDAPPASGQGVETVIHIAKHRNGATGIVNLLFDSEKVTFRDVEKRYDGSAWAG
ncbi:MAG: replicative DNA helicase [Candidatus Liptonbacteria bacterium]|nr:replicative DNA helicase [Candidatus Liptonbacteria bacterium]